ncbi:MAG: acetyltransferase [Clostridiales Family XIII bacterium]|nr:acetyltransferase [Clostridiales Family XIII bacterium]
MERSKVVLRDFTDADIALMEKWLYVPHVSDWYIAPDKWLKELGKRGTEFSFITHLIAEYEGVPFGFCQYYDFFYGQEHEDWLKTELPGEMFSIDYLIGDERFLHQGFGQAIIAIMLEKLKGQGVKRVAVKPDRNNVKSNRALEANGFVWVGTDYVLDLAARR